jgi:hypothetical protein
MTSLSLCRRRRNPLLEAETLRWKMMHVKQDGAVEQGARALRYQMSVLLHALYSHILGLNLGAEYKSLT